MTTLRSMLWRSRAARSADVDCEYCFFLSKESLYLGDRFPMSDELIDAYIGQLLESHPGLETTIAWQGGEPTLMAVDFFRRAFDTAERLRRPDQLLHDTIKPMERRSPTSGAS
jgi:uncharacterized protein